MPNASRRHRRIGKSQGNGSGGGGGTVTATGSRDWLSSHLDALRIWMTAKEVSGNLLDLNPVMAFGPGKVNLIGIEISLKITNLAQNLRFLSKICKNFQFFDPKFHG